VHEHEHATPKLFLGIILSEFRRRGNGMSGRMSALLTAHLSGQIDTDVLTDVSNALAMASGAAPAPVTDRSRLTPVRFALKQPYG
jgi:hypothetical protein